MKNASVKKAAAPRRPYFSLYALQWLLVLGLIAGLAAISIYALRFFDQSPSDPNISFQQVQITQPPPYLRDEIRSEVATLGGFDGSLNTLDPSLKPMLEAAFRLHPWVESVEEVAVAPGMVRVKLAYRVPVGRITIARKHYCLDGSGRLLPEVADRYLLLAIEGVGEPPRGGLLEPYGSDLVHSAARLAGLLTPHRASWKLKSIRIHQDRLRPGDTEFRVFTEGGTEIIWGLADEGRDREPWDRRLERLRGYVKEHKSLDADGPFELDLRDPTQILRRKKH